MAKVAKGLNKSEEICAYKRIKRLRMKTEDLSIRGYFWRKKEWGSAGKGELVISSWMSLFFLLGHKDKKKNGGFNFIHGLKMKL